MVILNFNIPIYLPSDYEQTIKTDLTTNLIKFEEIQKSIQLNSLNLQDDEKILIKKYPIVFLEEGGNVCYFYFFFNFKMKFYS